MTTPIRITGPDDDGLLWVVVSAGGLQGAISVRADDRIVGRAFLAAAEAARAPSVLGEGTDARDLAMKAIEKAAEVCDGRAASLSRDGKVSECIEASKCAIAIRALRPPASSSARAAPGAGDAGLLLDAIRVTLGTMQKPMERMNRVCAAGLVEPACDHGNLRALRKAMEVLQTAHDAALAAPPGAPAPIVRSDWKCEAGTAACPGTQGSLAKDWICTACGRKAHAPVTWRDKGLASKPKTYEPSAPPGSDTTEKGPSDG